MLSFVSLHRIGRRSVTFFSAGNQLAIGLADGFVLDPQSGDRLSYLRLSKVANKALAYSAISQQLANGSGDGSIYLWGGQSQEPGIKLEVFNFTLRSMDCFQQ